MQNSYEACIEACFRCAAACNNCATSCLKEEDVKPMVRCIQLDIECAAMCFMAAQLMSLDAAHARELCRLCADMCNTCAAECSKHDNDHCRKCAEACRACADECAKI